MKILIYPCYLDQATHKTDDDEKMMMLFITSSCLSASSSLRQYRSVTLLFWINSLVQLFQVSSLVVQQQGGGSYSTCNSSSSSSRSFTKSKSSLIQSPTLATTTTTTNTGLFMTVAADDADNNSGQAAATVSTTAADNHIVMKPPRHVKVLGVCGGIGSGKSAVCKMLVSEFGCLAHLEADTIAHGVYEPGSKAIQDIVQAFGPEVLVDNNSNDSNNNNHAATIDRAKLGSIVFADRSKMHQLERIVWPHVKAKIQQRIQEIDAQYGKELEKEEEAVKNSAATDTDEKEAKLNRRRRAIVIVEAAVLLDAGWDEMMKPDNGGAGVWVVRVSNPIARQRLIEQRGYTEQVADKRIQAQQEESRRGIGPENLQMELNRGTVTQVITNDGDLDDLRRALSQALSSFPS